MASCGTGCWGTFDVTIPYAVGQPGWGTLQVYEPSAKDGSLDEPDRVPGLAHAVGALGPGSAVTSTGRAGSR